MQFGEKLSKEILQRYFLAKVFVRHANYTLYSCLLTKYCGNLMSYNLRELINYERLRCQNSYVGFLEYFHVSPFIADIFSLVLIAVTLSRAQSSCLTYKEVAESWCRLRILFGIRFNAPRKFLFVFRFVLFSSFSLASSYSCSINLTKLLHRQKCTEFHPIHCTMSIYPTV